MGIRVLELMVTTDCNLRCRYCSLSGTESPQYMAWQVARTAIDAAAALAGGGCIEVRFSGGEPTMSMGLVTRAADYLGGRADLSLRTNATLIDRDIAEWLAALDVATDVGLDGPPVVNDGLRPAAGGGGSTAAALTGLERLRRSGVSVGVTCTLSASNVASLPLLVEMAAYAGNVKQLSLEPLRRSGRAGGRVVAAADPSDVRYWVQEALRRADALAAMDGPTVQIRECERLRQAVATGLARPSQCFITAGETLVVTPGGDCYPCASLVDKPEFLLGNVLDGGFVGALPHRLLRMRRLAEEPERCRACPDRNLCGGGCPVALHAHDLSGQPTECSIRQACLAYLRADRIAVPL